MPAVVNVRYPLVELPVQGFRCPKCCETHVMQNESNKLDRNASRIGAFGPIFAGTRKLIRIGKNIAVPFDREFLAEVLPGAKPGTPVIVSRVRKRIYVQRA